MTARRKLNTAVKTPALDFLRAVLADPKASRAEKLRCALALAPSEKAAATSDHELGKRAPAQRAAREPTGTDWDALLQQ